MMDLLTKGNPKLVKAKGKGYLSQGLHLAPHTLGGKNICPHASEGCVKACLNEAGRGYSKGVQTARIKKTQWFHSNRQEFMKKLFREIELKIKYCERKGMVPSFRLNLTSDVAWESIKINGKSLMEHFPKVKFYDYTPNLPRMLRFLTGDLPKNYHLTFSMKENNSSAVDMVLACGGNVAVVFDKKLPKTYKGKKVVNGMLHDLTFIHPKNVIVGLLAIGKAKKDNTGFVVKL